MPIDFASSLLTGIRARILREQEDKAPRWQFTRTQDDACEFIMRCLARMLDRALLIVKEQRQTDDRAAWGGKRGILRAFAMEYAADAPPESLAKRAIAIAREKPCRPLVFEDTANGQRLLSYFAKRTRGDMSMERGLNELANGIVEALVIAAEQVSVAGQVTLSVRCVASVRNDENNRAAFYHMPRIGAKKDKELAKEEERTANTTLQYRDTCGSCAGSGAQGEDLVKSILQANQPSQRFEFTGKW